MGAMKTIHLKRILGLPLSQTVRAFAGDAPWPLTPEERAAKRREKAELQAALKEAEEEAAAEREAIQWVERQVELRHARETAAKARQPPPIPAENAPLSQAALF